MTWNANLSLSLFVSVEWERNFRAFEAPQFDLTAKTLDTD